MRREEYLGNAGEQQYFNNESLQARLWTALPGIITAVDYTKFTVRVQPAIMGKTEDAEGVQTDVQLPMLVDVPVLFPNGGGWHLTCPIQVNDECLVVFASRCIDAWWQNGGVQKPMELRMNDLSDGFCILAPYSQPMASEVTGGFSNNSIIIRDDKKENYLEYVTGGDVNVLHQANLDWDTLGNADIYIKGNAVVKIDGTLDATVEGATTITCNSTLDATVQDNTTLTCNANVTETVQGNLSAKLIEPLAGFADEIKTGWVLQKISKQKNKITALKFNHQDVKLGANDIVISALDAKQYQLIFGGPQFDFNPIINIYFRTSVPLTLPNNIPFLGTPDNLADWIFINQDIVAVTISDSQNLQLKDEDLARRIWQEIRAVNGLTPAFLPPYRVMRHQRATICQDEKNQALRPTSAQTSYQNLFICGDWTMKNYPCCLEAAIKSAQRIIKEI